MGFGARRVFCFGVKAMGFPYETFQRHLAPYLQQELVDYGEQQFPREGVGCWHPIFPARSDDVWWRHLRQQSASRNEAKSNRRNPDSSCMNSFMVTMKDISPASYSMRQTDQRFRSSDGRYGLVITRQQCSRILMFCRQAPPKETGGILIGFTRIVCIGRS